MSLIINTLQKSFSSTFGLIDQIVNLLMKFILLHQNSCRFNIIIRNLWSTRTPIMVQQNLNFSLTRSSGQLNNSLDVKKVIVINLEYFTHSLFDYSLAKRHSVVDSIVQKETEKSGLIIRKIQNSLPTTSNTIKPSSCFIHQGKQFASCSDHVQEEISIGVLLPEYLHTSMATVFRLIDIKVSSKKT